MTGLFSRYFLMNRKKIINLYNKFTKDNKYKTNNSIYERHKTGLWNILLSRYIESLKISVWAIYFAAMRMHIFYISILLASAWDYMKEIKNIYSKKRSITFPLWSKENIKKGTLWSHTRLVYICKSLDVYLSGTEPKSTQINKPAFGEKKVPLQIDYSKFFFHT